MTLKRWLVRAGSALLVLAGVVASAAPLRVLDELVQVRTNGWTNVVPTNATAEGVFEWLESNVVSKTYLGDFTDDAITNYDNGIKVWIQGQDQALWTNVLASTSLLTGQFVAYTNQQSTNDAAFPNTWANYTNRIARTEPAGEIYRAVWSGEDISRYATNSAAYTAYTNYGGATNAVWTYLGY